MDHVIQLVILICSLSVATLSSFREVRIRRWGFVASLCGQPFWFWTAFKNNQWGIMLLAFYFSAMAIRGLWTHRLTAKMQFVEEVVFGIIPENKRQEMPILFVREKDNEDPKTP